MSRKNRKNFIPRVRKVRVPDQAGNLPFSVTFDHYVVSPTGKRDKFVERKTVKFDRTEDLADYFEQNCHQSQIADIAFGLGEGEND